MKKNVIVSLADSNYFALLNELIDSIKRFNESSNFAICIFFDSGRSMLNRCLIFSASGPETLIMAMPAFPGAEDKAYIVFELIGLYIFLFN